MARGWERKTVQAEIGLAAEPHAAPQGQAISRWTLDLQRKRESIMLSRARVMRDLENTRNPRYRAVLTKALADLDAQLANFAAPALTEPAAISTANNLTSEGMARILAIASAAFDDDERATRWLQEPNIQTGNRPPVSLIGTREGFATVESVLRQIQYGVFG
jgi:hypothetical protein